MEKKSFKENTANMNFKQKLSYIKTYYWVHIVVTLIIIIAVSSFAYNRLTDKNIILNLTAIGDQMNSDSFNKLESKANNDLVTNNKKDEIYFDAEYEFNPSIVTAKFAAKDFDIIMIDKKDFSSLAASGAFLDLTSLKSQDDLSKLNFINETDTSGPTKVNAPFGIDAASFPILKTLGYPSENNVIAIAGNSANKEKAIEFIKWLRKLNSI